MYRGPRLKGNDRGLRPSPQAEIPRGPPSAPLRPPARRFPRYLPWRVPPVRARPPQLLLPSFLPSFLSLPLRSFPFLLPFPSFPPPAPSSPGRKRRKRPRRFRERPRGGKEGANQRARRRPASASGRYKKRARGAGPAVAEEAPPGAEGAREGERGPGQPGRPARPRGWRLGVPLCLFGL